MLREQGVVTLAEAAPLSQFGTSVIWSFRMFEGFDKMLSSYVNARGYVDITMYHVARCQHSFLG